MLYCFIIMTQVKKSLFACSSPYKDVKWCEMCEHFSSLPNLCSRCSCRRKSMQKNTSVTFAANCYKYMYLSDCITKTSLFKYTENFTTKKWNFSDKNSDIFHISAQNIDCGYSLEPPRRGSSNEYPQSMFLSGNKKMSTCKQQFYYIKGGFNGVNII